MHCSVTKLVRMTGAALLWTTLTALASAQVGSPLLRDRDPLLPDAFNPPRSLVFVTRDDPDFVRFLGPQRPAVVGPAVVEAAPRNPAAPLQGVEVVDGADADRDGYVEYFDGASYVAELKQQQPLDKQANVMTFHGTLRGLHKTTYEGRDTPHQLLRVEHKDGRSALIDAGSVDGVARLKLRAGDPVAVVARPGLINDRPALIAHEVIVGEARVKVIRTPSVRQ
jgi:hypothetical protein